MQVRSRMPFCPRSSVRSERHHAKVEVTGASPVVDAILPLCLSSHRSDFVNHHSPVRVRPEAPSFALCASARQAILSGLWCNSSISPREGEGSGANPGFLTISDFRWADSCRLSLQNKGVVAHRERAAGCKSGDSGSSPVAKPRICGSTCPSSFLDGPLSLGYRQVPFRG